MKHTLKDPQNHQFLMETHFPTSISGLCSFIGGWGISWYIIYSHEIPRISIYIYIHTYRIFPWNPHANLTALIRDVAEVRRFTPRWSSCGSLRRKHTPCSSTNRCQTWGRLANPHQVLYVLSHGGEGYITDITWFSDCLVGFINQLMLDHGCWGESIDNKCQ